MQTEFEAHLKTLTSDIERRTDGIWLRTQPEELPAIASLMSENGFRLSTISAQVVQDYRIEAIYHYADGSHAYNIRTQTDDNSLPSIAGITQAAAWIEREIYDLYAVDFRGHPDLSRLIRPPELAPGFFRETLAGAKKHGHGPARPSER